MPQPPEEAHVARYRWCSIVFVIASGACTGNPDGGSEDNVESGAPATALRAIEDLRIDGNAVNLVPIRKAAAVVIGHDGGLAVAQPQAYEVRFFSATGEAVGAVGRRGAGPGEFEGIGRLGRIADTIWVLDERMSRLTMLAPNRTVLRTRSLQNDIQKAASGKLTFMAYSTDAVYPDGSMLAFGEIDDATVSTALMRVMANGTPSELVAPVGRVDETRSIRTARGSVVSGELFRSGPLHDVSADGSTIAITRMHLDGSKQGTFSVTLIDSKGDTLMGRVYPFEAEPIPSQITDSMVTAVAARLDPELAAAFRRGVYVPPVYPPFRDLVLSDEGSVWLRQRTAAGHQSYVVLQAPEWRIGTVRFPMNTMVAAVSRSTVWALETDPDGVESIVRYRLER